MKPWGGLLAALCGLALAGCDRDRNLASKGSSGQQVLHAWVSIAPQAFFVGRVGKEHVDVQVLVQAGQSPATFEPTSKQLVQLARSDVYFRIGVPFEDALIGKLGAVTKEVTLIDTREGITLRQMQGGHSHGHDDGHGDAAGAADPHTWLDPALVKIQAATICRALCELDADHAGTYRRNLAAFEAELDTARVEIGRLLAPLQDRRFYVFHPAYGYFADAFGLHQVAVEASGQGPSAKQLTELIERARQDGVRTIFVQPQFGIASAQAVADAIGGAVVPLDPLASEYLANLNDMAQKVRSALLAESDGLAAVPSETAQSWGKRHE